MAFNDGDFLEIDFSMWDKSSNALVATTDEAKAKDGKIYHDGAKYSPVLLVVGQKGTIKGLDREVRQMKVGEQKKFDFKPEDAFGERSEDLVRVMPMSEFRNRDISPYPGMEVELDNTTAVVRSVNAGRVVVDANNRLAGKEISYEVKVVRQVTAPDEKVKELSKSYNVEASSVKMAGDKLEVRYDSKVPKNAEYFVGKAGLVAAVFTHLNEVKNVEVVEEYKKPEAQKDAVQG